MTHIDLIFSGPESSENLNSFIQMYLQKVSKVNPESTYLSQKTHLSAFLRWYRNTTGDSATLQELVARYLRYILTSNLSISTIRDYASTLVNLLAYIHQENPEIIRERISTSLLTSTNHRSQLLARELGSDSVNDTLQSKIQALRMYLRQRKFGCRTHVFVELVIDTKSSLEQIRKIDLAELNLEENNVSIGVPDTHLVSSLGLLTEHTVSLADTTVEVLETYIELQRDDVTEEGLKPLLTTFHGRASSVTLRRSVQEASEEAFRYCSEIDSVDLDCLSGKELQPMNPSHLRQYALSEIGEET